MKSCGCVPLSRYMFPEINDAFFDIILHVNMCKSLSVVIPVYKFHANIDMFQTMRYTKTAFFISDDFVNYLLINMGKL